MFYLHNWSARYIWLESIWKGGCLGCSEMIWKICQSYSKVYSVLRLYAGALTHVSFKCFIRMCSFWRSNLLAMYWWKGKVKSDFNLLQMKRTLNHVDLSVNYSSWSETVCVCVCDLSIILLICSKIICLGAWDLIFFKYLRSYNLMANIVFNFSECWKNVKRSGKNLFFFFLVFLSLGSSCSPLFYLKG